MRKNESWACQHASWCSEREAHTKTIFIHPNLREARPLMVVGGPRCGTRFVAGALNRSSKVFIQGEIQPEVMDHAIGFLSGATHYFASAPKWAASWENSRRPLLYALWASMVKSTPSPPRTRVDWFGHKTPRHDRYWKFYRDFLGEDRPKYVFCMRNFVDHYLSMNSMNELATIDLVARKYRASVARYAEMKTALGDDVLLFVLDDLSKDGVDYLRKTLFERLDIEVDERRVSRIDVSRPANSTEGAGRLRRKDLTAHERAFLAKNEDLLEALHALRAARPLERASDDRATWKSWLSHRRGGARRPLGSTSTWSHL
jgi:hypothetical protein